MSLISKSKAKEKIVEFVHNQYYLEDSFPRFRDITNKFNKPPFTRGNATISRYLDELVEEGEIRKIRDDSKVRYAPPQMGFDKKLFLLIASFIAIVCPLSYIFLNNFWTPFFCGVSMLFINFLYATQKK